MSYNSKGFWYKSTAAVLLFFVVPAAIYVVGADVSQWVLIHYATVAANDEIIIRPIMFNRPPLHTGIKYDSFVLLIGPLAFISQWVVAVLVLLACVRRPLRRS